MDGYETKLSDTIALLLQLHVNQSYLGIVVPLVLSFFDGDRVCKNLTADPIAEQRPMSRCLDLALKWRLLCPCSEFAENSSTFLFRR